jgi:hypothetical protein
MTTLATGVNGELAPDFSNSGYSNSTRVEMTWAQNGQVFPGVMFLDVPSTGDANGNPILLASSATPGLDTDEAISFTPVLLANRNVTLVVKRVSGSGTWSLKQNPQIVSIKINGGAYSTTSTTVTLNNTCQGAPTMYLASERSDFAGAVWQPYSAAPTFLLSSSRGTKRVYFRVRNAEHVVSTARSDTILLSE